MPLVEHTIIGVCVLLVLASVILTACDRIKLPFTIVLVLAGTGLSFLSLRYPGLAAPLHMVKISPDLILYVFLPTLIFESAFGMDGRLLLRNLWPVLTLAVPGLLISTFIIGGILAFFTPLPVVPALLLGAILSATDPVSVIALFKKLGAPARLTMLVEGESLLNDASSIVVARLLMGIIVAGALTVRSVTQGCVDLVVIFSGGFIAGWLLGMLAGWLFGRIKLDPFVQITLTLVLAYCSFLFAEKVLHASGVMATLGAGLALGGWGKEKIAPAVQSTLEHFWGYMAFVANALLFLMVGLRVNPAELSGSLVPLAWVCVAMLVSRAVVVYGLVPLVSGKEKVGLKHQTIIFWGGLRGGIAIALALSLPAFPHTENFIALVLGAVLFTLLAHGLTIEPLLKFFKLDVPPLPDRFAGLQVRLMARQKAAGRIPELAWGGCYSGTVAERLTRECAEGIAALRLEIEALKNAEITGTETERSLLLLLSFANEKAFFIDMLHKGHIGERAFKDHAFVMTLQADAVRRGRSLEGTSAEAGIRKNKRLRLLARLAAFPFLKERTERFRLLIISLEYEKSWTRQLGTAHVLAHLDDLAHLNALSPKAVEAVRAYYADWNGTAKRKLDEIAEQFPEFVLERQERLGRRLLLLAEAETVEQHAAEGLLVKGMAESIGRELSERIDSLKSAAVSKLIIGPSELLRKVPFFRNIPSAEFSAIAERMRGRTAVEGEVIIRQGEPGSSLYLIARGVARVSRADNGARREVATLVAGEFFGEMALLHHEPRNATVRAATACSLYELTRQDLNAVCAAHPAIRQDLQEADRRRQAELNAKS